MLSPAAAHKAKITGAEPRRSVPVSDANREVITQRQFDTERHQMSHIRSRIRRNHAKSKAVVKYQPWIEGQMMNVNPTVTGQAMFVWLLMWKIDAGLWGDALVMAKHALKLGMFSPVGFNRTLAETLAENISDGISKAGTLVEHSNVLSELAALVNGHDLGDEIAAKLLKAQGLSIIETQPEKAKVFLNQALGFNPRCGVVRLLKQMETKPLKVVKSQNKPRIDDYTLSARQAAAVVGVSAPTIIRHAKKHPNLLPHLCIPMGSKHVYRFNKKQVKQYLKKHLVSKK